jgi:SAM-dependent methyltransferase
MNEEKYKRLKEEYDLFHRLLLRNGTLPMFSTELGFWNSSSTEDLYGIFKRLKLNNFKSFLDLGSGDGKAVLIAALFGVVAHGVEIDEFLINKSVEFREKMGIKNASFLKKDYHNHDFSKYDMIFLAPDKPLRRGLEQKLVKELNGKLILYGPIYHPRGLKKEESFFVNNTLVTIYSKRTT